MNSLFLPSKGLHFYATAKPRERILSGGLSSGDRLVTVSDGSYRNTILICEGADALVIVARIAAQTYSYGSEERKHILRIADYDFAPVGPEVLRSMGLLPPEGAQEPVAATLPDVIVAADQQP